MSLLWFLPSLYRMKTGFREARALSEVWVLSELFLLVLPASLQNGNGVLLASIRGVGLAGACTGSSNLFTEWKLDQER